MENARNELSLTPVSADPSEVGAITPDHFLLGKQTNAIPSVAGVDEFDHRKRYVRAQSYANAFFFSLYQRVRPDNEQMF